MIKKIIQKLSMDISNLLRELKKEGKIINAGKKGKGSYWCIVK